MCGKPKTRQSIVLQLPSKAAVALFYQINGCLPTDPGKFALKLLTAFFSEEQLARSNCTKVEGRELLDQQVLLGIKCKFMYIKDIGGITDFCTLYRSGEL